MTLTPRQKQVVDLLYTGLSNREIGKQMGVNERTVKTHLTEVFTKLGVKSTRELLAAEIARLRGSVVYRG